MDTINRLEDDNSWNSWSRYIITTLEKLSAVLEQQSKDRANFRLKMLKDLNDLKIEITDKIILSEKQNKKDLTEIVDKIKSLIKDVSDENDSTNKDFLDFKEKVVLPLRIRVAVISIICGFLGGGIMSILVPLIVKAFGG